MQLVKDGGRYWVVGILWDAERPGLAIPDKDWAGKAERVCF